MASQGWISIYRKLQDNEIWNDKPFNRGAAWIDLLLMANHEDSKVMFNGNVIEVKRGEKITSLRKLSERWGWSITKVKKFLNLLSDEKMISYKSDSKKTTYTICNYNIYQDTENGKSNTEITLKENRNNTEINQKEIRNKTEINQKETNNNDNNDNNENKNNPGGLSEPKLDNPQLAKLIKIYEGAGFGMINPYAAKILEDYLGEYGYEWVKEAIEIASEKGVRNLSYINGILKNMRSGKSQAKKKEKTYQKKSKYYKPVDHELSQDAKTFNDMLVNSFMENDI